MKQTLEIINRLQAEGVIQRYAIGGAVGATFYLEPSATLDIDVFVLLPRSSGSLLVSLTPIYDHLQRLGCKVEHEHIVLGDWPVQFLSASDALEEEALVEAAQTEVEGEPTHVMTAEHLMAIALKTGRPKDHVRILQFVELSRYDEKKFIDILGRHQLVQKWRRFRSRFLKENNG